MLNSHAQTWKNHLPKPQIGKIFTSKSTLLKITQCPPRDLCLNRMSFQIWEHHPEHWGKMNPFFWWNISNTDGLKKLSFTYLLDNSLLFGTSGVPWSGQLFDFLRVIHCHWAGEGQSHGSSMIFTPWRYFASSKREGLEIGLRKGKIIICRKPGVPCRLLKQPHSSLQFVWFRFFAFNGGKLYRVLTWWTRWWFHFLNFHRYLGKMNPIWLAHIFHMGGETTKKVKD